MKIKENIKKIAKDLNKQGLRVVAVCQKNNLEKTSEFTVADEKNMVLIGFIGFLDPPKESAKSSIEKLNKNGIRVIVLTGDNVEVTKCICDKVGIKSPKIVIGSQIDKLQDIAVKRLLKKTDSQQRQIQTRERQYFRMSIFQLLQRKCLIFQLLSL